MDDGVGAQYPSPDVAQDPSGPASNKRKAANSTPTAGNSGTGQVRAKRNRYISIACNECKRRKIKCNGETPCQRCGNLSLECIYAPNCCGSSFKDSEEFRQMAAHLQSLQDQVNHLYQSLGGLQGRPDSASNGAYPSTASPVGPLDPQIAFQSPAPSRELPRPPHRPRYSGPTSATFDFNVANSSLATMGITGSAFPPEDAPVEESPVGKPASPPSSATRFNANSLKDPLWSLDQDEAARLCRVYEEEINMMYPMLDIEQIISKIKSLFSFAQRQMKQGDPLDDDDTLILKLITATALAQESDGQSELGRSLWENVRRISSSQDWLSKPATIKSLQVCVIMAQYYFVTDEEVQSYRIIGLAARACFELGLHRSEVVAKLASSDEDLKWTMRLFWVIYTLDRRWSFGMGMPFAIQDSDLDPNLPEVDDGSPYLKAMVAYGHISSKVWTCIAGFDSINGDVRRDDIAYLDYEIQQWRRAIPDMLQFQPSDNDDDDVAMPRGIRRLRILLYLRANQLRIQLYRPVLYSITRIMENRAYAQTVVEIAKDTIRVLTDLNRTSNIYQSQPASFHYFLLGALAVLFLAVSHAPAEFNQQIREEFYMALDLVKGFSAHSSIARRLWTTIKSLKEVAPKLGLVSGQTIVANDTAVAMARLAGHQVDEMALYPQGRPSVFGSNPESGQQMSHELTNLFEAVGGYGTANPTRQEGGVVPAPVVSAAEIARTATEGYGPPNGNEEELVRIIKGCF